LARTGIPVSTGLRLGRREFAPSMALTLLMAALAAVFGLLGRWQWHLGQQRAAQYARFVRGAAHVIPLGGAPLSTVPLYQRVSVRGRYDGAHQFLLDNSIHDGADGYEVLTPLLREGAPAVLVDRGWVAFTGSRSRLPDTHLAASRSVTVIGRVGPLPTAGLSFGRAPPPPGPHWPKVTSFPRTAELSAALGRPLARRILLLDPAAPEGYVRAWTLPGMPALENWGYAIQWWAFAVTAGVIWLILSLRRSRP
jgi:surfeit locus 1 family protein